MRRSAVLVPILFLAACGHAGAGTRTAAETETVRDYEVGVCGHGYAIANIGGRNQNGEFVHTPNFRLTGGTRPCGIHPGWWFRPNQVLEINARGTNGEWRRLFRTIAKCTYGGAGRRWCAI